MTTDTFLGLLSYIGPGLGAGAIAIILGFFASVGLILFSLVWYPLKRLLQATRGSKKEAEEIESE